MRQLIILALLGLVPINSVLAQNAADAYWGEAQMAASRDALKKNNGGQTNSLILVERIESQIRNGDAEAVWEAQGWIGGDINKAWLKTEGEFSDEDSRFEEAELQALYSRAISPFWDVQFGVRHDFRPDPSRNYAVVGFQGLAPYWFEVDAQVFLSDQGDVSVRLEGEYELRLTQRLILQPRVELNAAFSDDAEIGVGAGLSEVDVGLRLRYEIRREFAPYLGVSWNRQFGATQALLVAEDRSIDEFAWVAGLRMWF